MKIARTRTKVCRKTATLAASIFLLVGGIIGVGIGWGERTNAALEYDNGAIADVMLGYLGQNGVEICRRAGRSLSNAGECKQTVNCAISIASGGRQYPFGSNDYHTAFQNAGGVEVSSSNAKKGDIIQVQTSASLHTAVVINNLGGNNFDVVDSNFNWDGIVRRHNWSLPGGARIWRMGTVKGIDKPVCDAVASNTACVWRLTNNTTGHHFYTSDINERNAIMNNGNYRFEGLAFYARTIHSPGTNPVYRLRWGTKYLWTDSVVERDYIVKSVGAVVEGIAWYANNSTLDSGYSIYRLYDGRNGDHLWTASKAEADAAARAGWKLDGIAFYGASPMVVDVEKISDQSRVYRIALQNEHFWTTSIPERDAVLKQSGSRYEGVAWTASGYSNSRPVYRFTKPDGQHFWTSELAEKNAVAAMAGWRYEGIAWYENNNASRNVYRLNNPSNGRYLWTASEAEVDNVTKNMGYRLEGISWRY